MVVEVHPLYEGSAKAYDERLNELCEMILRGAMKSEWEAKRQELSNIFRSHLNILAGEDE